MNQLFNLFKHLFQRKVRSDSPASIHDKSDEISYLSQLAEKQSIIFNQVQKEIDQKTEQLNGILDNTSDAYIMLNNDWIISYINPASENMLDISIKESVGRDLREAMPDITSMFYKILHACLRDQKPKNTIVLYGPTMKHIEAYTYPCRNGIALSLRDISRRKISEDAFYKIQQEQTLNKQKLQHAAELTSYMNAIDEHALVSISDTAGIIIHANEKFCKVSGYNKDELLGKQHNIINSGIHPKSYFETLWKTITAGKKWHGEVCNRSKDGSLYWVDSAIVPIKNENNEIIQYLSVRIDITDRKQQAAEMKQALDDLAITNTKLERISKIDGLTQIANRRYFDETLNNEIGRLSRKHAPLSLIICDIDYFKNYNDHYGHPAGDHCLQLVAKSIESCFSRSGDLVARYGGEEFAVILPDIEADTALLLAEKMRKNIELLNIEHQANPDQNHITISTGVSTVLTDQTTTAASLIEHADSALYVAKKNGRNNVQFK